MRRALLTRRSNARGEVLKTFNVCKGAVSSSGGAVSFASGRACAACCCCIAHCWVLRGLLPCLIVHGTRIVGLLQLHHPIIYVVLACGHSLVLPSRLLSLLPASVEIVFCLRHVSPSHFNAACLAPFPPPLFTSYKLYLHHRPTGGLREE